MDPRLEQWKYQYGYDPLCSVSWTHIATEHVGLDNPPAPCCGSRHTARKVMRQQTAEVALYPVDVKLPMSPAPSSSIFSGEGTGAKLMFTGNSPMPMFVTSGTYRVQTGGHADGCSKAGDTTNDYFDSLDPRCVMRMPEPVAIKIPADPQGLLGNYGHGRSFATAVLEDALRGGEGCATYSSIEENKAEIAFGRASHGYAVAHFQFMHHLEVEVGEIDIDALSGLDQHLLLRRLLLERLRNMPEGKRFAPLQRPAVLSPSADVCGSVVAMHSKLEVPLLRREIQGVARAVESNAASVTFDHCQPIARAITLDGDVDSIAKRQCFHGSHCATGHNLGGVIVPGTAASHVKPFLSQLAADTEYSRVCVDNAGMSDSMYTDPETFNVKPENVVQGTGHLLRRVSGSFHPTCLLKRAARASSWG